MPLQGVTQYRFWWYRGKKMHACKAWKAYIYIQMSLQYSVLWLQDQHWQLLTYDWKEWRGSWFCFMIAPVARCLSMMLEYSYLLREDNQLMHECHQQKLHFYNILRELHTYQADHCCMGSSNNCFSRATIIYQVNGVGTRALMGDAWEVHWTTLPEVTQACRELIWCGCKKGCRGCCKCQRATLKCTALCCCALVQWLILTVRLIEFFYCYMQ